METAVMTVTAAAEKTTAAFRMGFPFTKVLLSITKVEFDRCIRKGHGERSH
jgi:hypothetical protein